MTDLVKTAQTGGAPVTKKKRYAVIPLASGSVVAAGARGCQAILINAQRSQGRAVPRRRGVRGARWVA